MNREITSLDLYYIIQEMQGILQGKIDKIFQIGKKEFYFRVHVPNEGKKILRIKAPQVMTLTSKMPEVPMIPPGYCAFLRKHLANARIRKIWQQGFERIVNITLETKETKFLLIIEMFSRGNIILCKEDRTILSPLEGKDWSSRTIRKGLVYEYPPEVINLHTLQYEEFEKLVEGSDKGNLVKTLAMDIGLGGVYAESILEVSKGKTDLKKLYKEIKGLLNKKLKPVMEKKRIYPFKISTIENYSPFESIEKAMDSLVDVKKELPKNKYKVILEKQTENIGRIEDKIKEETKKGETIYNHYEELKKLMEQTNELKEKYTWKEIIEKLEGHKVKKGKKVIYEIIKIKPKEKTIEIEL